MNTDKNKTVQKERSSGGISAKKAAMYVRMSTDHQKYSTENQADAIRDYAARYNIEIIETYADQGKSGLSLDGRDALKRLIDDVQANRATFNVILVLDVTRWGRFQDADESAYYEYICRRAGIDVQYVAEQFENDGSPVSTIVKGVTGLLPDIIIAIRMDHENVQPLDYYILPSLDIENPKIRLADQNHYALELFRFDDLEPFFLLTERCALPEVA